MSGIKLTSIQVLSDILGFVGYDTTPEQIKKLSKERREQIEIYVNGIISDSKDNPEPSWLQETKKAG